MKVLIAPDKFKGTLTATQVCDYIESGLLQTSSRLMIRKIPLADGGEGTLDVFLENTGGIKILKEVHDPLMRAHKAYYGLSGDGKIAFVELAQASGLVLLTKQERNPLRTSTLGTGELFVHAIESGVKKIIVGIGGSATNDAATGALHALGFRFLDGSGREVTPNGENLRLIRKVDSTLVHPSLESVEFIAMCDVTNPLYGELGAAYVYAPQKGASDKEVAVLDQGLRNFAEIARHYSGLDLQLVKGAGAGGGFAGGMKSFVNAQLMPGTEVIFQVTGLEEAVQWADLVITGEGKLDRQSLHGKLVGGVGELAMKFDKPMLAVCGVSELSRSDSDRLGITEVFSLVDNVGAQEAMQSAGASLMKIAGNHIGTKWISTLPD